MPRIITSETDQGTVDALAAVAKKNLRSQGKEALVAIQSHVLAQTIKPSSRAKQPRRAAK